MYAQSFEGKKGADLLYIRKRERQTREMLYIVYISSVLWEKFLERR